MMYSCQKIINPCLDIMYLRKYMMFEGMNITFLEKYVMFGKGIADIERNLWGYVCEFVDVSVTVPNLLI